MVDLKGIGLRPLGTGLYTFGETGTGMQLFGTGPGLLARIKRFARPLLKLGKQAAISAARTQLGRIRQPEARRLAEKGLDVAESGDIEEALKGQDKLGRVAKVAQKALRGAEPELRGLAQKGVRRGTKLITGKGAPMMDTPAATSDRALRKSNLGRTQDQRQLTLLKDVIRSAPIKTKTIRGTGLSPL